MRNGNQAFLDQYLTTQPRFGLQLFGNFLAFPKLQEEGMEKLDQFRWSLHQLKIKELVGTMLLAWREQLTVQRTQADSELKVNTERHARLVQTNRGARKTRAVDAANRCEIELCTTELEQRLIATHLMDEEKLDDLVSRHFKQKKINTARELLAVKNGFELLRTLTLKHFQRMLHQYSITDVVATLANQAGSAVQVESRTRAVVNASSPCWQADPGRLGHSMPENVVIGIPAGSEPASAKHVSSIFQRQVAAIRNVRGNEPAVSTCAIEDPHRIVMLRTVTGGRPHFLASFAKSASAYREWLLNGRHPVNILSKPDTAAIGDLVPQSELNPVYWIAGWALSVGAVAERGSEFYWNMEQSLVNDQRHYHLKLTSDRNGHMFKDGEFNPSSVLKKFLFETGRLSLGDNPAPVQSDWIGSDLEAVVHYLSHRSEYRKLCEDLFHDIFSVTDASTCATLLEREVAALHSASARPADPQYRWNMMFAQGLGTKRDALIKP